ncbi:MAG: enoyl-CoA hydratase, partial [Actinomycetota bacterium]
AGTDEVVRYEIRGRVALITLNRPDRLNAWTGELGTAYFDSLDRAAADPSVVAIVVTGAGRGFCAGADMDVLQGIGGGGGGSDDAPDTRDARHALSIPKPVIAAVNGACAGLGFVHAVACDLRFAAAGAKFTTSFSRRGLIAEHGLSWTLPRLVGQANALDLLLSGRVILAEEALELGLVNRVLPPDELVDATLAYADELAGNAAPLSMAIMKQQVYRHPLLPLDEAMEESNALMRASLRRPDFKEGVASFLEKRAPSFTPVTERPEL